MKKRIESLTPEQGARFAEFRDKWLAVGLSIEPADRARAEAGARLAYETAGMKPPQIVVWSADTAARRLGEIAVGEWIRQGDVYCVRIRARPKGWSKDGASRQLAPGTTQGSRHVVSDGPMVYAKPQDADALLGPVIVARDRFEITHPEHAHFSLPAGTYQVRYQQDLNAEERRAVRD